ncbi:hypothetical protein EYF80_067976 [Liparis tanakae]|jgi:hypothetical protein
MGGE